MKVAWMLQAFEFAKKNLPNLLQEFGEGKEVEAFEELARRFRAERTEQIKDRSDQIEKNRSEIDRKLADRKRASKKS